MQLTIDSSESLHDVLRAVGAIYSVELVVASSGESAAAPETSTPARPSRRRAGSARTARAGTTRAAKPSSRAKGGARESRRSGATKPGSSAARRLATEIRTWAAQNGHDVSARGRIPSSVVQAYEAAQH